MWLPEMSTPLLLGLDVSSCNIGGLNVFGVTCEEDSDGQVNKSSQ